MNDFVPPVHVTTQMPLHSESLDKKDPAAARLFPWSGTPMVHTRRVFAFDVKVTRCPHMHVLSILRQWGSHSNFSRSILGPTVYCVRDSLRDKN